MYIVAAKIEYRILSIIIALRYGVGQLGYGTYSEREQDMGTPPRQNILSMTGRIFRKMGCEKQGYG